MSRCRQCMCFLLQAGKIDALWVGKCPVPSKVEGKAAMTAHRITEITGTTITFTYKDYADGKQRRT